MRLAVAGYPLLAKRQWKLCQEFVDADVEVHLLVPERWPEVPEADHPSADAPFEIHRHNALFAGRKGMYLTPALPRTLHSLDVDGLVVQGEPWHAFTLTTVAAASALDIPTAVFSWENLDHVPQSRLQQLLERVTLPLVDGIIGGNPDAARRIKAHGYDGPVTVAPQTGVDTDVFTPASNSTVRKRFGVPEEAKVVLYAGRLAPEKGIDLLLEAIPGVVDACTDAHCLVVGDGSLADQLRAQVQRGGIEDSVTLVTERQPYNLMPDIMATASVFAYPSQTTDDWAEQFGYSVAEAMSCAVPVVTTECGALPYVVGDTGRVCSESNVAEIESALSELLVDDPLRENLGKQARQRVLDEFSLEIVADAHLSFIEELTD